MALSFVIKSEIQKFVLVVELPRQSISIYVFIYIEHITIAQLFYCMICFHYFFSLSWKKV